MKTAWCFLFFISVTVAHAQTQEARRFVRYNLRNFDRFFVAPMAEDRIRDVKTALNRDTIRSEEKHYQEPIRTLVLSGEERAYILSELDKSSQLDEYRQLFEPGTVIPVADQKVLFYDKSQKGLNATEKGDSNWVDFSLPLFIRDHSLCIFYYWAGSQGRLAVYRRTTDDAWLPWLTVFSGIR
ncbi:hypothetical protein ACFPMF_05140 [Larkinella bovis]|uniref:Uncharacterized protein n=1 Tax=Larkinella bovis TaxID=683041 RepID=A0ABW0I7V3_9BACT